MGTHLVESEDWDDGGLSPTTETCAQCEEQLIYTEDIVIIQVMSPRIVGERVVLTPVLEDDSIDFFYEHYYLHFKCWEEIVGDLREEITDAPPVIDSLCIARCECCDGGIREGEPAGTATMGELIRSKRSPSGTGRSLGLVENGAPDVFCMWCMSMINENWLEFWEGGISIDGECFECQHARCWWTFDCSCICHGENNE